MQGGGCSTRCGVGLYSCLQHLFPSWNDRRVAINGALRRSANRSDDVLVGKSGSVNCQTQALAAFDSHRPSFRLDAGSVPSLPDDPGLTPSGGERRGAESVGIELYVGVSPSVAV